MEVAGYRIAGSFDGGVQDLDNDQQQNGSKKQSVAAP
jgi:hypothetical protein